MKLKKLKGIKILILTWSFEEIIIMVNDKKASTWRGSKRLHQIKEFQKFELFQKH